MLSNSASPSAPHAFTITVVASDCRSPARIAGPGVRLQARDRAPGSAAIAGFPGCDCGFTGSIAGPGVRLRVPGDAIAGPRVRLQVPGDAIAGSRIRLRVRDTIAGSRDDDCRFPGYDAGSRDAIAGPGCDCRVPGYDCRFQAAAVISHDQPASDIIRNPASNPAAAGGPPDKTERI
jgi:hypothetical protein